MASTVAPAKNFDPVLTAGIVSTGSSTPTFSTAVKTGQINQTAAYVDFTLGSLTSLQLVFQASYDGVHYYDKPMLDFSSGAVSSGAFVFPVNPAVMQLTSSQAIFIDIPACYQYVRFKAWCTGTTTGSSLAISVGSGSV